MSLDSEDIPRAAKELAEATGEPIEKFIPGDEHPQIQPEDAETDTQ